MCSDVFGFVLSLQIFMRVPAAGVTAWRNGGLSGSWAAFVTPLVIGPMGHRQF